jgi:tetratricopeptide (TPR) repeat protein
MASLSTDSLFRLIKSLNGPEKRYLKLYVARHVSEDKTGSELLFDIMDGLVEYDEEAIKEHLNGHSFLKTFSSSKARLMELIMRSLDAFHSESSVDAQLRRELHYAELYFKKNLFEDCMKTVANAKKIAYEYERFNILLELFPWEKNCLTVASLTGKTEDDLNLILAEEKKILRILENESEYWNIKSRFFLMLNKNGTLRDKDDLEKFNAIINHPLMKSEKMAHSYRGKNFYYHILGSYYFAIGDYNNSYKFLKKLAALMEKHLKIMEQEPHNYITVLMNIINSCHLLHKQDEIYKYLKKIRNVAKKAPANQREFLEIKVFADSYNIELALDNEKGEYKTGMMLLPEIEEGLERFSGKINKFQETILYYNLSLICFGAGEYSQALKWLNIILNYKTIEITQELFCFSKILNLIIHLELGNDEFLPHILRSTHRFLEQKHKLYKFENVFLEFIKKMSNYPNEKEILNYYQELKIELNGLANDPFERRAFDYFDFLSWAESKISNKPFAQIVQEKNKS